MKSIRFAADTMFTKTRNPKDWIKTAQHIEKIGYSTLYECDHFSTEEHDPIVLLSAAAAATKKIKLGTLVFAVDYRHPVIYAKSAATLHLISGGRFEFGIGAGWDQRDYNMAGIQFDKPIVRIRRLNEALTIIRKMWTQEKTTFNGKYYKLSEMVQAGLLSEGDHPKIMVGGGGRKLLSVAGRHADIVGISSRENPLVQVKKRIEWVKESARKHGRDVDDIEFQMQFAYSKITDDPEPVYRHVSERTGVPLDMLKESVQILICPVDEMIDKLSLLCEETDISYIDFAPIDMKDHDIFAKEVIPALK
jgi:probable F420-dependent oxidoreductase